jgi:transposase
MQLNVEEYDFYVRPGITDLRKHATGLSRIVQDQMKLMPFKKSVFLFCGRDHKKIVAIVWNNNGWIEISKRLECRSTFRWPETEQEAMKVNFSEILLLLRGIDVWRKLPVISPQFVN